MYCPKCGSFNDEDARYCAYCGVALRGDHTQPVKLHASNQATFPPQNQDPMYYGAYDSANTSEQNMHFQGNTTAQFVNPQAPQAQPKSTALALLISFFLPGLGIAYLNKVGKGFNYFIIAFITYAIYPLLGIIIYFYALYATYKEAQRYNNQIMNNQLFFTP